MESDEDIPQQPDEQAMGVHAEAGEGDGADVEAHVVEQRNARDAAGEATEDEELIEENDEEGGHIEEFPEAGDDFQDTTADQLAAGKDIQGIPWETTPYTRLLYRAKRDMDFRSYYNREDEVKAAEAELAASVKPTQEVFNLKTPFVFYRNWRRIRSTIVHFQLRNLLWATSRNDVFYISDNRVLRWNNLSNENPTTLFDVSGSVASAVAPGIGPAALCTLCVKNGLVAAGGFNGELLAQRIGSKNTFDASLRVTTSENGITNAIDIYKSSSGALRIACSNNDQALRLYDALTFLPVSQFHMPWAVNCAVSNPSGRLICTVGDDPEGVLLDAVTGTTIARLRGHYDYSFAAAWHPDGMIVATGNQDLTTRVYDLRMAARPLAVLRARLGAVRSLRFSPDGRTLAVAEPADYVTLYDIASGFERRQTIDFFGELAGIAFSPDGERLYASIADAHYGSLLQYNRRKGAGAGGWGRVHPCGPWRGGVSIAVCS